MITKDFYKADIYRVDIEKTDGTFRVDVSNVISWDIIRLDMNKEDLKGLADFIYRYLEQDKQSIKDNWNYTKPIIGTDADGKPIVIDSWNNKENN
jgi:hypothetical protein